MAFHKARLPLNKVIAKRKEARYSGTTTRRTKQQKKMARRTKQQTKMPRRTKQQTKMPRRTKHQTKMPRRNKLLKEARNQSQEWS